MERAQRGIGRAIDRAVVRVVVPDPVGLRRDLGGLGGEAGLRLRGWERRRPRGRRAARRRARSPRPSRRRGSAGRRPRRGSASTAGCGCCRRSPAPVSIGCRPGSAIRSSTVSRASNARPSSTRAIERRPVAVGAEPEPGAARVGIGHRRDPSAQVRDESHAVAAGRHALRPRRSARRGRPRRRRTAQRNHSIEAPAVWKAAEDVVDRPLDLDHALVVAARAQARARRSAPRARRSAPRRVPIELNSTPGASACAASPPTMWSWPATPTAQPVVSPVAAAASAVTLPSRVPQGRIGANSAGSSPTSRISSSAQARRARSSASEREASVRSALATPAQPPGEIVADVQPQHGCAPAPPADWP